MVGAQPQGIHRAFHRAVTGNDDYQQIRINFFQGFENIDTVFGSQVKIEQCQIHIPAIDLFPGFSRAGGLADLIPLV